MSEETKLTEEERQKIISQIWESWDSIEKVEDISYIQNGNGRRKLVFKTSVLGTIITMEEPTGSKSRKDINARLKDEETDFDLGLKWISRLEYTDGNKSSKGKEIIDPSDPSATASTHNEIEKEILEWGVEESDCVAIAFTYLNKKIFYSKEISMR